MKRTRIAAHDADQKQRSVMNINLNRCGSSKEKQMNTITRTALLRFAQVM